MFALPMKTIQKIALSVWMLTLVFSYTSLTAGNDPGSVDRLMDIIHHSETAMFTKANMNADKLQIMHDTQILLQSIKA